MKGNAAGFFKRMIPFYWEQIVIFIVDLNAPLLWQPVNPSLSSAVAVRGVSFSTCHFDALPGALVLVPSALALPRVIKGSPANHTRWNVRGRLPANGSRCSFRMNPGWRHSLFCCCTYSAGWCSSTHLLCFILLALVWHWDSLMQQCTQPICYQ